MNSHQEELLKHIYDYVSDKLKHVDAGHDLSHVLRVLHNAIHINGVEKANGFLVEAGALLHDITDEKLFDKSKAEHELHCFLHEIGLKDKEVLQIFEIINAVSFGSEFDKDRVLTPEQKVVRDADRLDALGAIGIARTFHYGGSKDRELFNPEIPPMAYQSTQEYRNSTSPTINHFYEKLLLLKDRMETEMGKELAKERHLFMEGFLKQFYSEIGHDGF
ncbi:HD domain-containing protein [Plebeiibacterium marinum]|uniref:HD domain-containing protein n=1 Tax=Plebeiibacterium marinum TaxID=2992111 RepID=A0AAE3MAW0_9BACT|nr:HD domain-containing protein [Plebeiobacterium marinum]MCW3804343.1 HD domain-containing protein [Plebeiobacterium marinum]